ncbi:2-C-methyl-D-erythritol 2,4-cyclodiphosphate synthase [bacterium (candidate division B38) B3_B38]|nr:MAG: 2-C-methyl-D-erythritol 2,4-cyclodiphosphate synthase [bacterium (candidate division B38) B3_B38]
MYRVGMGYDLHPMGEGRPLVLGGVTIPFPKGLEGYSDADVLTHSLCDALLGAVGKGDIGHHFPDSSPQYKGISSLLLLERVMEIIVEGGYSVVNIDSVIIAEHPKLAPYIEQMKTKLSRVMKIDPGRISVKATTNEGLGSLGRGEAIAAHTVVLVSKPD